MTGCLHRSRVHARLALLCLASAGAGALAGCLGAGDDTLVLPRASDAGDAGDGSHEAAVDAPHEAADAPMMPDTGGMDATLIDGEAGGAPIASFSYSPIDFGPVGCGAMGAQTFTIRNVGGGSLAVTATTTGQGFSVTPAILTVAGGMSGTLTLSADVPATTVAGSMISGSLNLLTSDPVNSNASLHLSATATGATLAFPLGASTTVAFPASKVNTPAPPLMLTLVNTGNAAATFNLVTPAGLHFALSGLPDGGSVMLGPSQVWTTSVGFTPTNTALVSDNVTVTGSGVLCGSSLSAIKFTGQGVTGTITGWPTAPIDFGAVNCGGGAPASQTFTLTNTGTVDAKITQLSVPSSSGFGVSSSSQVIAANGGAAVLTVTAPAVPATSSLTPVTATLTVQTDADSSAHSVTLQEEPTGAILSFDTKGTHAPGGTFGSFGSVVLLGTPVSQTFNVDNTGNAPATVTLVASMTSGTDAGADATVDSGKPDPFTVSNPTFTIAKAASATTPATQSDSLSFSPVMANANNGTLAITLSQPDGGVADGGASTVLCAPLPAPLPLTGFGIGAGLSFNPGTALTFNATCGGSAPAAQTLTLTNVGTTDLNWTRSGVTGAGTSVYTVTGPTNGSLAPNATAIINVAAAAFAGPGADASVPNPDPSLLAAQFTISTDVPYDSPHVISLSELPAGDQLAFSTSSLQFGQFPINTTTLAQTFTVTNNANAGSPPANFSLVLGGSGSSAYAVTPTSVSNLAPGTVSATKAVTFNPTSAMQYPATISISTTDTLCTPLPPPLQLAGSGTAGQVTLSATTLTFGTDSTDPKGFVNCGKTGTTQTLTVTNAGNQAFNITNAALGNTTSPSYSVTRSWSSLPASLAIGASATITLAPKPIPQDADPNNAALFADTLTVTTDAAGDTPHTVNLVMQARGAIIGNTPLNTTWNFGTVGAGSIGTITSNIQNTGNAAASVSLSGLAQPSIFGLQNNPTTVAASGYTSIVGTFAPPSSNGGWSDQGTLTVTTSEAFCQKQLPMQWTTPTIGLSGSSNSNPAITLSGSLAFPSTDCGSAAPAGQSVTLYNHTNQNYNYTVSFFSGQHYQYVEAFPGQIPANTMATVTVTPLTVTPGQGVPAGSSAYADNLFITVNTSPTTYFTLPITWTLNGAVLSLPDGAGPKTTSADGSTISYYPADFTTAHTLPMSNTGNATASVNIGIAPNSAFSFSPSPPLQILPGVSSTPEVLGTASDPACPSFTAGSATFNYSGPVCQPFAQSSVNVFACSGSF